MPNLPPLPASLLRRHSRSRDGRLWLEALPNYFNELLDLWQLTPDLPDGIEPWSGFTGIVIPVTRNDGGKAALKLAFPYEEVLLEPLALTLWDGKGMVELLENDPQRTAILLQRLDATTSLQQLPIDQAVSHWGKVMRHLSIEPDRRQGWDRIPHVAALAEQFTDELPQRWEELNRPFPRWLLEAALEVCQRRGAVGRRESHDVLVHGDLHFMNILQEIDGQSFMAIDPQAKIGDAEFAVAPCLWNRLEDLPRHNSEAALRQRASDLCAAANLDEEVALEWSVVREVENALDYLASNDVDDAQRSLWVASSLVGRTLPGLPQAHELQRLG